MTWLGCLSRQGNRQTLTYRRLHCAYVFVVQLANSNYVGNRKHHRALTSELTYWSEAWGISCSAQQREEKVSIKWIQETKQEEKKDGIAEELCGSSMAQWLESLIHKQQDNGLIPLFVHQPAGCLSVSLINWLNPDMLTYFKIPGTRPGKYLKFNWLGFIEEAKDYKSKRCQMNKMWQ